MRHLPKFLLTAAVGLLVGCGPKPAHTPAVGRAGDAARPLGDTLKLTVVPYEAAEKLSEDYGLMAAYLARRAGCREGKFVPVMDYAGVLAALQSGQIDVAYLSPFPYALATSRMKLHPLAMPWVKGSLLYHGILFVRADSPIKSIEDLAGKVVVFGDPSSTSGYLLPRMLLERAGVFEKLKGWRNASYAAMVKAVEMGQADAGAAYESVFEVVYRETPEKAKRMRVIGKTDEIPNGIYVARGDLPAEQVEALRKAFLDMNTDPEGKTAMLKAPNDKIVPAEDSLFDSVRAAAKSLNIDITLFDRKK